MRWILLAGCFLAGCGGLSDGETACKTMCAATLDKLVVCGWVAFTDSERDDAIDDCLDRARDIRDAEQASDEEMRTTCNAERSRVGSLSCAQVDAELGY